MNILLPFVSPIVGQARPLRQATLGNICKYCAYEWRYCAAYAIIKQKAVCLWTEILFAAEKQADIMDISNILCSAHLHVSARKDKIESSELIPLLVIIALGVIGAALSIGMNAGAYFHIRENKIKARYGLFGRIDCSMDEIEYALPRNNELIIGMKDGKHHTITEISNSYELSSAIRRQILRLRQKHRTFWRRSLMKMRLRSTKE